MKSAVRLSVDLKSTGCRVGVDIVSWMAAVLLVFSCQPQAPLVAEASTKSKPKVAPKIVKIEKRQKIPKDDSIQKKAQKVTKPLGVVKTTCGLKLRKGLGQGTPAVASLKEGEILRVIAPRGKPKEIEEKKDYFFLVKRKNGETGYAFGGFLEAVKKETAKGDDALVVSESSAPKSPSDIRPVHSDILPALLKKRGYTPTDTFKALLIEIVKNKDGGYSYYPMDYMGTSEDRDDWWPASTVKLYAAIAALEKSKDLGFNPNAEFTFHYEDEPVTQVMDRMVRRAITDSKNPEFDRLVEFVGADNLNRSFLTAKNGLSRTAMMRAYSGRVKHPMTGKSLNRHSPKIVLRLNDMKTTLSEQTGRGAYACYNHGNCTNLKELAEALRRVMMHEYLPNEERYKLGRKELILLRSALQGKWAKGGVNDGLRAAFKGRPIEIFHKGGYADRWFSDNIFLRIKDTDEQWIVAMVNRPGRESLNVAALHVAELLANGELSVARKAAYDKDDDETLPVNTIDVLARELWEANPPKRFYKRHEIERFTLHHQAIVFKDARRAPKRMKTMQEYHQSDEKEFLDVAYHFIVDPEGNIYQGRPYWAAGETQSGYDPTGHLLVCMMGDFERQEPEPTQLDALVRLLAWAAREFKVSPDTIKGHGDYAYSTCPGKNIRTLINDKTLSKRVQTLTEQSIHRIRFVGGNEGEERIGDIEAGR